MNIRDEIEFEYFKEGRLVKHPSGYEEFETKEEIEERINNLHDPFDVAALEQINSL